MLVYPHKSLDHFRTNQETAKALHKQFISKEEYAAVEKAYPVNLYRPNIFIRVGLFLATVVIVFMSFGLLSLFFGFAARYYGALCIVFSFFVYSALELLISKKRHFRSGVDDALLWMSTGFMAAGINLIFPSLSSQAEALLFFVLSLYATLRFANSVMCGVMFLSLLAITFYTLLPLSPMAMLIMPFVIMVLSFGVYLLVKKNENKIVLRHYKHCLLMLEVLTLFGVYASGNYFVVREATNSLFNLRLSGNASVPGGWFFWATTVFIPIAYVVRSLQTKDAVMFRIGLFSMAATILTLHQYYSIAPVEVVMTAGGCALIVLSYFVSKYLKVPKHGITISEQNNPDLAGYLQLEGLVLSETFHQNPSVDTPGGVRFGGGSSGGGGASGEY